MRAKAIATYPVCMELRQTITHGFACTLDRFPGNVSVLPNDALERLVQDLVTPPGLEETLLREAQQNVAETDRVKDVRIEQCDEGHPLLVVDSQALSFTPEPLERGVAFGISTMFVGEEILQGNATWVPTTRKGRETLRRSAACCVVSSAVTGKTVMPFPN